MTPRPPIVADTPYIPRPAQRLASTDPDALIGQTVGNFRITRKLGSGGMGTVYLGENPNIGSRVAVKVLHPHLAGDPTLVERFHAEARAANLVGHENIVRIIDLDRLSNGGYYLVMEYLEGRPLSALTGVPMAPARALPILGQICDALAAAHERGIVHRDLKPENVFLEDRGGRRDFVKIVDFGIAKLRSASSITATGTITGTPEYMSPEQWEGAAIDHRADVYALGITAWTVLAGSPPFRGEPMALYVAHATKTPPPLRDRNPQVTRALESAIRKAVEKDPSQRWSDLSLMRQALLESLTPAKTVTRSEPPPLATPRPAPTPTPAVPPPAPKVEAPSPKKARPEFEVRVAIPDGPTVRTRAADLSKAGAFLFLDTPFPPLRSRLKVLFGPPETSVACAADVVHHVSPEDARAWNMPPGVGVQFVQPSSAFLDALARLRRGEAPTREPTREDPEAAAFITRIERTPDDPYRLLGISDETEQTELRMKLRQLGEQASMLRAKPLPSSQKTRLEAVIQRLNSARAALTRPEDRARLDAERGNFRGVARCLAAGLSATELERLRASYLEQHPGAEGSAHVHALSARARQSAGQTEAALRDYESALRLDPLDLKLHQQYWTLRRRVS